MTPDFLDRLPPQDLTAEQQVLGCVLLKPAIMDDLPSLLGVDDFYADANRRLYAALVAMSATDARIDTHLLTDCLRTRGEFEAIGGTAYLVEVLQSVAVWQHWRSYAGIVLRKSKSRQCIQAAGNVLSMAWEDEPEDVVAAAERLFSNIQTGSYDTDPVTMLDACVGAMSEINEIAARTKSAGVFIGIEEIDEKVGGVFPGELCIVAARPGQGKTSLALQMAAHIAQRARRVYFATLEMSRTELAIKRLCSVSGVSNQQVRSGRIGPDEQRRLMEAGNEVGVTNLHLHDWPQIRCYDIERAARRLKSEVVFVDYLQIVTPPDERKKRHEQVGDVAKSLKLLSRRLDVPVIACCQVGRQAEQQRETHPKLSHLRESGDIENHADLVMLLWRPDGGVEGKHAYEGDKWDAEIEIAKNRKGISGRFRLDWDGDTTTFRSHSFAPVGPSGNWDPDSWIGGGADDDVF